jgi:hypothetical protein
VDEHFVSLASLVRAAKPADGAAFPSAPASAPRVEPPPTAHAEVVHELARLRLAALDAYDRAARRLLRTLADDVLGRELRAAPADVGALAARALEAFAECEPVALVLAPGDVERVRVPLPTRVDAALAPGDFAIEVRDGAFESPLRLRFDAALERVAKETP